MISKYNKCFISNKNKFVYNLASRKIMQISDETYRMLSEGQEKHLINMPEYSILKKNGVIFEHCFDEADAFIKSYLNNENSRLHLVILGSTGCNFRCQYCYIQESTQTFTREYSLRLLKWLDKVLKNYKGLMINWFGGEPLLAKEEVVFLSENILKIANKSHVPLIAHMTTNGYFLDIETFKSLIRNRIIYYQITIDGLKDTHDIYRPLKNGNGTYDVIISNLKSICSQQETGRFFINIRNNITRENRKSCEDFKDEFKSLFGGNYHFSLTQFPVKDWGGERINGIRQELLSETDLLPLRGVHTTTDLCDSLETVRCYATKRNGFVIDPRCNVYKCSHLYSDKDGLTNYIGKISEEGELSIDENLNMQWSMPRISNKCFLCFFLPYCMSYYCPYSKLEETSSCKDMMANRLNGQISTEVSQL